MTYRVKSYLAVAWRWIVIGRWKLIFKPLARYLPIHVLVALFQVDEIADSEY